MRHGLVAAWSPWTFSSDLTQLAGKCNFDYQPYFVMDCCEMEVRRWPTLLRPALLSSPTVPVDVACYVAVYGSANLEIF